jgi:membrane protein implicated in regulation of membrane protease activity
VDWLILIVMLAGLAMLGAGLAMVWTPLAVLFGGGVLCAVATSAYVRKQKERRG